MQTLNDFQARSEDRALFDRLLRSFVPPNAFDVHVHLYQLDVLGSSNAATLLKRGPGTVDWDAYARATESYMGDRAPSEGLAFGFPTPDGDMAASNEFVSREIACRPDSRSLMLIRPDDDPGHVEHQAKDHGHVGFKVYHVYADRADTPNATIDEYLPEWAWEIADRHGLAIMLHIVRPKALLDPANAQYIRQRCLRYGSAKLILAHAARGFCGRHTVEGIDAVRGLHNLFFDTSAVCEAAPLEAILRTFGPSRLLFGSDHPVSSLTGRCVSAADSFVWLYHDSVQWIDEPTLVGIEALLALKQACHTCHLNDADVEQIFGGSVRRELGIGIQKTNDSGQSAYEQAKAIIPGGTQLLSKRPEMFAPGAWPPYYSEARGVEVIDLDRRRFIDMTTTGIGACLLGYADPEVNAAVSRRLMLGSAASLNGAEELTLAEILLELHPWAQMVRFGRGGGEAMAMAARIARAHTGRDVIAFCGYHGWQDWYLAANLADDDRLAESLLPGLKPKGVPAGLGGTAHPFAYNRLDELEVITHKHGKNLAAIIMEPTRSVDPVPGFLEGVRELADVNGAVMVFDEITTGFRLGPGGAHLHYGVNPDMAVFGKALGNGVPVAALVGKAGVMKAAQETFISSTMWTEGLGTAAAVATLRKMQRVDVPAHVHRIGTKLRAGLARIAADSDLPIRISGHPAITAIGFEHADAQALLTLLTIRLLDHGILAGGSFYPSLAHEDHHVHQYLSAVREVVPELTKAVDAGDAIKRVRGQVKHAGFARLT